MCNVEIHDSYDKMFMNKKKFIDRNMNYIDSSHFAEFNNIIVNNFFNFSYEIDMNLKCNRFFCFSNFCICRFRT